MSINFPDPNITQEFTAGNGITYIWDVYDSKWVIKSAGSDSLYVQKTGDTMTGPLTMDNASEIQMTNTSLNFQAKGESLKDVNGDPVLNADGNEQWDDQVNRFIDIESQVPRLIKSDGQVVQDTGSTSADAYGINFDLSGGNTYKNTLQVSAKDDWIFRVASGGTPTIKFNDTFDLTKNPTYDIETGVAIRGIPTPGDNTPSDFAVNKDYVDTKDEELRQDIIEIEEELEAIAPSLERGLWVFNPIGAAGVGQYGLFALGTATNEYPQADHLFINSVDKNGAVHNFGDVKEGTYLEIFSPDDGDFGLYQVVENNGETTGANSYWDFTLDHIQSNRLLADAEGACRFKFFELAEGADPNTFVLKRGDTMTGNLEIIKDPDSSEEGAAALVLQGRRNTATESCATIAFRNENNDVDYASGYLTYLNYGNNQYFQFNKDLKVNGNLTATNELRGTVLNSAKDSNLSIQRNNETKILVGSDAVQVQRPIKFVNSSFATEDDHAIHKGYVDEQIANIDTGGGGLSGDCVEINGGSLCAADPNPRFYDVLRWTDNQKIGRKPFSTNRGSNYHFYSGTQNKWVYIYRDGTSSSSSNKLRFSIADGLDDAYTGGDYYRNISNPSSSLIKFGTEYLVSGDYIYYHEVSYNANASSSKKHRAVYSWNWKTNTLAYINSIYASYTGSHKFYIDYKGNVHGRGYQTYYNNGSELQYYAGSHNPRTDERKTLEPSRKQAVDLLPHLLPTTDTQAPGLWHWYGGTNSSLSSTSTSQLMQYTYTDENDEWQRKDITSLMPRTTSTFNSSRATRAYVRTNKGAITRDLLWVYDAAGLNEGEAYVFGIFHSGSYPTRYSVDDNLTFDIWRAKVTLSEVQNINWLTLFDSGKKVFHGPGFCERLDYIAGEIVTRTRSGAVSTSNNNPGEVVQVYPDTVVASTLDGGENWQQRTVSSKNPTERNYYAYRLFKGDHNIFQPYYSDEFIYYYVQEQYDIKPGTLANADGQIDADDYIPKINGENGYFQLTFPYPVSESQPLYWNGVDIGKPFEPEDLNFHDYPPLPQADQ